MSDLAQRSQLFNRACELARARLHLVEQPHVLDRDRRLACESCQQCNLLVREWPHLGATNPERANGLVLPQQGNGENGPVSEAARTRAAIGELVGGGLDVVHVDRFPINEGAPKDPAAFDRQTGKIHWDRAVMSSEMKPFTRTYMKNRIVRLAKPASTLRDYLQHRLNVCRGSCDHA